MADIPLWQQRDAYGEQIKVKRFDWRDEQLLRWIAKFPEIGQYDSEGNIIRQRATDKKGRPRSTGTLLRSVHWRTWSAYGGDMQVFEARYLYYAKFVELALGKDNPFRQLPPDIPKPKWDPIKMPDRKRKARPSIPTEMRRQGEKFTTMLQEQFLFHGLAALHYPFNNSIENSDLVDRMLYVKRALRVANYI